MKIPVLTSSFYFHNCLEEDVLDAFPSIWSWIESFTLMWLISTCKLSTRCFERAKIVFLQVTHFRKKVVNQIVICSFLYSKCLFEKILHLITEIILTPSSSFLGEDREFLYSGENFVQAFDEVHLFLWNICGILLIFRWCLWQIF